ncbi:MAG: lysophospholipid acyltransferase family protein [Pseudomonadota bacterium]
MISQSMDGDIIAGVARRTGWCPVRGSSSKGGKEALKVMIGRLKETGLAAHIMDGPRGPIGRVKRGAIRLALEANAVIVPFYVSADRAWFFKSWDRFFLPKPFARVTLRYDNIIRLFEPKVEADLEAQRQSIENIMRNELK